MSTTITVLHIQGHRPEAVEDALAAIFTREERPRVLRIEGTYAAVLARATDPDLAAAYRYVILRPHASSTWTPVLEVGNRADGLDVELSGTLDGAAVFTTFVFGDIVSGYRLARAGALVDRYASDPTYGAGDEEDEASGSPASVAEDVDIESERAHPERFADLLPAGTPPEDFVRVVLAPGWWETHDTEATGAPNAATDDEDELVDETDRMRCIGLALELWAPDEYPFAQDPEDIPNTVAGPAIAVAFT
ncbi:MAG TPA: hypothetical protein VKQ30_09120 [Ktedonobacterales bacterium]|nr:hypothetical protein [Ktedonobacterales bacterium]